MKEQKTRWRNINQNGGTENKMEERKQIEGTENKMEELKTRWRNRKQDG